jgi:hypothetical protein
MLVMAAAATLASCAGKAPSAAPTGQAGAVASAGPGTEDGFVPLFNGRDLTGWTGDTAGYMVEDGAIACGPSGTNLYTVGEWSDFELRLRFRLAPGANNGIGVRAPLAGDAAYEGMEIQVLDDGHEKYRGWLKPWQRHGSVYGISPSTGSTEALRPAGEWNDESILVHGRRVKVTLNGRVIQDADLDAATKAGTLSGKDHPGLRRASGHIGFLGHGDRVEYRDIRIRPIAAATTTNR